MGEEVPNGATMWESRTVIVAGSPGWATSLSSQLVPGVPIGTLVFSTETGYEGLTWLTPDVVTNPRPASGARVPSAA